MSVVVGIVGSSELLFLKTHSPVVKTGTSGGRKTWCIAGKFLAKNAAAWPSGSAGRRWREAWWGGQRTSSVCMGSHCALPPLLSTHFLHYISHIIVEWVVLFCDNAKLPPPTQNKTKFGVLSCGQTYHYPIKVIWALSPSPPHLHNFISALKRKGRDLDTSRVDERETDLANTGL